MKKFQAFTMAEAILVMTVLGIIATIMITTLRPSEFQEKGLQILAKKVLSEVDTATSNVLFNDSADSTFDHLYKDGSTDMFTVGGAGNIDASTELTKLYKKYVVTTRKAGAANNELNLKNGAYVLVMFQDVGGTVDSIFPGETNTTAVSAPYGFLQLDINGTGDTDGPNIIGKDKFLIPLAKNGIQYE